MGNVNGTVGFYSSDSTEFWQFELDDGRSSVLLTTMGAFLVNNVRNTEGASATLDEIVKTMADKKIDTLKIGLGAGISPFEDNNEPEVTILSHIERLEIVGGGDAGGPSIAHLITPKLKMLSLRSCSAGQLSDELLWKAIADAAIDVFTWQQVPSDFNFVCCGEHLESVVANAKQLDLDSIVLKNLAKDERILARAVGKLMKELPPI